MMNTTIRLRDRLLDLSTPKVMGILNATPDSFYDGSRMASADEAIKKAEEMIVQGVDILDVGGQSTRPGSQRVGIDEELRRVLPIIKALTDRFPDVPLSIDTYYGQVAREAVSAGAVIINDISAWEIDPGMFDAVCELQVPYMLTHMQGRPETMQDKPLYKDVVNDVFKFFTMKTNSLRTAGVGDILIDPGFGFGKTMEHNYALLGRMREFLPLNYPIIAGVSRKGMIYRLLGTNPEGAVNGSTAAHMIALMNGASLLRVHDVAEACEAVKIYSFTQAQS